MMSCGMCSKWQHIACHDRADAHAGRKRRNWDDVEFICLQCRSRNTVARGADLRGNQRLQPPAAPVVQPPRQSQNPYMVQTAAGAVPFNPSLYMGVPHANYGVHGPVNGNGTSYAREAQVSHARSTPSTSSANPQPQQQVQHQAHTQQPYGSTIAFSHYQPQERGFSTTASSARAYAVAASAYTQPYGQQPHAGGSVNPYMQYGPAATTNGGAQSYQVNSSFCILCYPILIELLSRQPRIDGMSPRQRKYQATPRLSPHTRHPITLLHLATTCKV